MDSLCHSNFLIISLKVHKIAYCPRDAGVFQSRGCLGWTPDGYFEKHLTYSTFAHPIQCRKPELNKISRTKDIKILKKIEHYSALFKKLR